MKTKKDKSFKNNSIQYFFIFLGAIFLIIDFISNGITSPVGTFWLGYGLGGLLLK